MTCSPLLPARTPAPWLAWLLMALLCQGCASIYKPKNSAIAAVDNGRGYRYGIAGRASDHGDHVVFLAFSGGGTRAAALSYGVMQELRDTRIDARGKRVRLLDEVDVISSVSGGSFTSAYYGLFGDRLFEDYEDVFLRQSVQGTLIRQLFNPEYWWRSLFTGFDRTEMAVEYYDSHIFEGKTFADMPRGHGPFIHINATDLGGGHRFSFHQPAFDLICSNLDEFSVARAVTASSAVPVAFPPVVLENHSDRCDTAEAIRIRNLRNAANPNLRQQVQLEQLQSYSNRAARPYIHLVDGGIADNLGLRALIDSLDAFGADALVMNEAGIPKDVLVILVNAEVNPERSLELSAAKPTVVDTVDAVTNAQIALYNRETLTLVAERMNTIEENLRGRGHDIRFYLIEVSFASLEQKTLKSYFNNLPTSLELDDSEVDLLIRTGRELLRRSPKYKAFLAANSGGVK